VNVIALVVTRLARVGLNLVGATPIAAYDARVPPARRLGDRADGARTAIVVGNGGAAFWRAFRHAVPDPSNDSDPLDRFTRAVVADATGDLAGARVVHPFDRDGGLDFRTLAEVAGLGRPSLLGLLVHPEYGPWIAFRAAILVPDAVVAPRPADGFDPCPGCVERPCIAACPAGAIGPRGWDVPACSAHRLADQANCATGCHARLDCVYGRPHRPPAEALAFHQAAARRMMARYASAPRKA
jgi:hypothetical protein